MNALTFPPISATALSSSDCRRPVMKTCAPFLAKRFAAPRPIPALPPATRAILFASLLLMTIVLRDCDKGVADRDETRRGCAVCGKPSAVSCEFHSLPAIDRRHARDM